MDCRAVSGVTFGPRSLEAIEEIKRKHHLSVMLQVVVPVGTIASIFVGNGALDSAYNVYSTDFAMMARAVAAVPAVERVVILRIAQLAALDTAGQESEFWKQVARGISHECAVVK